MGNLADKKTLREQAGEKIHKGEAVISEKDEMMFIPFIKSGSKDETRPWLYKGFYRMPDGAINIEGKRYDGLLELTIECSEKHKEYLSEAIEAFTKKVYDHSAHPVESITVEEHETETDVLKKEIERLQHILEENNKTVEKFRELMESIE